MNEPIKVQKAIVRFFNELTVEGYRMPDGSFRIGLKGASLLLGYGKQWLSRAVENQTPNTLKKLQVYGFTNEIINIVTESSQSNLFDDRTISLKDFQRCIIYAIQANKDAAIAINLAFSEIALIDFFKDAFEEQPLTIDEKRELFYQTYASTISPENWRDMDRQDIVNLALYGDELQLKDGLWNF